MAIILGINAFHAGASATLVIDGKPVAAIAEERLNRIKYYAGFPKLAIKCCLETAGIKISDVNFVAVGRDTSANLGKKLQYALINPGKIINLLKIRSKAVRNFDDLKPLFATELNVDASELLFKQHNVEHHLAHIASSYFISTWDHCAGVSIDGSGDFVTCMIAECSGSEIAIKHRVYVPHSLGSLYTMICEFIGYDRYGDEGKVMGLAPLGSDTFTSEIRNMIKLETKGISLNPEYFTPIGANQGFKITDNGQCELQRHYTDKVIELFGIPRARNTEITQRDKDLAYGLQVVFEEAYMHLLRIAHQLIPSDKIALAGGCALNSVANGKLFEETPFKETAIQPASSDDGLSMGAALYVSNSILKEGKRFELKHSYLGPDYSDEAIRIALHDANIHYEECDRTTLISRTVDEIEKGNVVGWFQGKMEWGPRALGNRSILAHPGYPGMKDILNARIKHREPFRPFAPAVLEHRQSEIFEHDYPSPFMLHVYLIKPNWRERLSSVNHIDNTGRLQSVSREQNELFFDLISEFDKRTGIPIILNTSFNENEPIVCKPEEAIDCFCRTKMDALSIGSFFCKKI